MTLYYFDTFDGSEWSRDDHGVRLETLLDMRRAALAALPDMAHDTMPDSDQRVFGVRVRDDSGLYLFEVKLSLEARWLNGPAEDPPHKA